MVSENKFSKYLLYAIGEIVLVVIGILIALSINNWNEDRSNRLKETHLLESFRIDLLANRLELERVIFKSNITESIADSILMYKKGELLDLSFSQLDMLIMDATGFTVYKTHEGTVQDILGSGILDIIENDSIRLGIGSWQASLKDLREWESLDKESSRKYMDYLKEHIDIYNFRDGILAQESATALFDDRVFLNHVSTRRRTPSILNSLYQQELPKLNHLLSIVNSELDK